MTGLRRGGDRDTRSPRVRASVVPPADGNVWSLYREQGPSRCFRQNFGPVPTYPHGCSRPLVVLAQKLAELEPYPRDLVVAVEADLELAANLDARHAQQADGERELRRHAIVGRLDTPKLVEPAT